MFKKSVDVAVCAECGHVFEAWRAQHIVGGGIYCPQHSKRYDEVRRSSDENYYFAKKRVDERGRCFIDDIAPEELDAYFALRTAREGWRKPLKRPAK